MGLFMIFSFSRYVAAFDKICIFMRLNNLDVNPFIKCDKNKDIRYHVKTSFYCGEESQLEY